MPGQPQVGPEISIKALRGINLRKSRSQLDEGECVNNSGFYPKQTGQMSRLHGKKLLRVFEDGDTPRPVYQVAQAFMGQSYLIAQNGDAIWMDTLDVLFNRSVPFDLTPTPAAGTLGSYALLAHQESNGAAPSSLGSPNNIFYPATINTLLTDADGIVQTVSGNSFTLGLGTYQIDATILFSGPTSGSQCRAGLFSISANAFKANLDTFTEIIGTTGRVPTSIGTSNLNGTIFIKGRFQVTLPSEVLTVAMAFSGAGVSQQGIPAALITSKSEVYKLINITKE